MCAVAIPIVLAAIAVVSSVAKNVSQNKAMHRQERALNEQNRLRAEQIADAASAEMNDRARAVRRARASARATASEAGINLSSGSFLATLQNFSAQEDIQSGLVTKNENNQQAARKAEYKSALSQITYKNGLGITLDAAQAGLSAYMGAGGTFGGGTAGAGMTGASTFSGPTGTGTYTGAGSTAYTWPGAKR